MASIGTMKEAIGLCRVGGVTPWIWGVHGIGKSSLVKQVAQENNWGFVDLRASQIEASDIRGLPDRSKDGRTVYLPPGDMPYGDMTPEQIAEQLGPKPHDDDRSGWNAYNQRLRLMQPHYQCGILFLDELNRAADDVIQAVFQLVLDRGVGQYTLPEGWNIVVAGNFTEGYQVKNFNDPAFLNRFCHLTLSPGETTLGEWVAYMGETHGGAAAQVVEFAAQNIKHLDGEIAGEQTHTIQPSRRSWDAVARVLEASAAGGKGRFSDVATQEVLAGLVGRELAASFTRYSCPVKPQELMEKGVKAMAKKLGELNRQQMNGFMWGLVSFCRPRIEEAKVVEVALDYADWMCNHANDKDLVVAFCRAMVSSGNPNDSAEKTRTATISNPKLAKLLADFYKKQPGGQKVSFITALAERPKLQAVLSRTAWGA